MSVSCGCDATFAGMAVCHCQKCHYSFADRPAYDAHRRLARPCIHPTALGMELIGNKGALPESECIDSLGEVAAVQ